MYVMDIGYVLCESCLGRKLTYRVLVLIPRQLYIHPPPHVQQRLRGRELTAKERKKRKQGLGGVEPIEILCIQLMERSETETED